MRVVRPFLFLLLSTAVATFVPSQYSNNAKASTLLFMNKKGSKKLRSSPKGFAGAAIRGLQESTFPYAGSIRPGSQSPQKVVEEESIMKPDYHETGTPKGRGTPRLPWMIEVKTPEEIEKMRKAGKLARQVLDLAGRAVLVGVTTDEIDHLVHDATLEVRE